MPSITATFGVKTAAEASETGTIAHRHSMIDTRRSKCLSFDDLTMKIEELSVLPHVVFKVLEITASGEASATEIERAIVVDPGFCGKVLVMANSAAFGLPKQVSSIREAVSFLGYRNLRNVALTVGAFDLFVGKTDKESLRRREWWRHSIDSAVIARWLAAKTRLLPPDEAYTCGLLHQIGKTLIDRYAGSDYEQVIEMTRLGITDYVSERDTYGYDHAAVAVRAAEKWGLPETLRSALNYLEAPDADDGAGVHRSCLAIASWLAYHLKGNVLTPPMWAAARLGLDSESLTSLTHSGPEILAANGIGF